MRLFVIATVFAAACFGQAYKVTVSMAPIDVYRAVMQSHLKQVALYEAIVCAGPADVTIAGGRIMQHANANGVQTMDRRLLSVARDAGARNSKFQKVYKVAYYVGWAGSLLTVGGTVATSRGTQIGLLLFTQGAGELKGEMDRRANKANEVIPGFMDATDEIVLRPKACASRLFLGMYVRDFKGFEVEGK